MQSKNSLFSLLILIIILIGAVFLFRNYKDDRISGEKVVITKVDINAENPADKVPAGLPLDIPLQLNEVTDSHIQEYPERGVTVSTITFKTFRSLPESFSMYEGFMKNAEYSIDSESTSKELGVIYGEKDGNTLGIIINKNNESDGTRTVQIVYTNYPK